VTPEEQWDFLNAQLYKYGVSRPWEIRLREIAAEVVRMPQTYELDGVRIPFKREAWRLVKQRPFHDARVRLIPDLKAHPDIARLVVEQIIRREVPW
jgi:hypothetical protein